jgi:hypothetical protein
MRRIVTAAHLVTAFTLAIALVAIGAIAADRFDLPLIHSWALAHGAILIVFPIYFLLAYLSLVPVARRIREKYSLNDGDVKRKLSFLALWAFVLAGVGFILLPLVGSVIAIVMGLLARHRIKNRSDLDGAGIAMAAIIMGSIGLAFWIYVIITVSFEVSKT